MSTFSMQLADFALGLRYEDLPEEVVADIRMRALDTLGVAVAGIRLASSQATLDMVCEWGGKAESPVIGAPYRLPMAGAGLVNGQLGHSYDFDDTHSASLVHASACIIPAALTLAGGLGLSGAEAVTLAAAGYETALRIGLLAKGRMHLRGFHTTSLCGALGVALMAGRAYRLSLEEATSALGIAAGMASGLLEAVKDGSWSKLLNTGWAVHSGIVAAQLAKRGFTGPAAALEGEYGFYRSHLGEFDEGAFSEIISTLGKTWLTPEISYKLYPTCHHLHAFIDSIQILKQQHGIRPDNVQEVECRVAPGQAPVICEPWEPRTHPDTEYGARFSLPYTVAVALANDQVGIDSFAAEMRRDPQVLQLARRVRYSLNEEVDFPRYLPSWVLIKTKDGQVFEHRLKSCRGGDGLPLTYDDLVQKFRGTAGRELPEETVEELVHMLARLDHFDSVIPLIERTQSAFSQENPVRP